MQAPRTRVKICGLTRAEDVRAACALGADAVGFVCYPGSPRYVEPARLAPLAAAAGPFVTPVLLFVNAGREEVSAALSLVPMALLQFHGDEGPRFCASFGRPYVRAVAVAAGVDLVDFERTYAGARALLADSPGAGFGGSGQRFEWGRLPPPDRRALPLILAGGLDSGNVGGAIEQVRPYAVDVSSGVESERGIKSVDRMREFLMAVRRADAQSKEA
jgi:phosphoribosylanthranilate isomerase